MKTISMSLLVQLEFKVRDGVEAEFLRVARALASAAATESETLRYQWFVTQQIGHYAIIEEYADADAAEAHNNRVAPLLCELFAIADLARVAFYGELNEYIRDWISGREGVGINTPL